MKTQIIRLEPHDDFISARDKMGWSQTGRILLVYPEQVHVLNRRLDLILLHRHSRSLGAQLALVTEDKEVIYQARNLGLPVFKDVQKALKVPWRAKRQARRSYYPSRRDSHTQMDLESLRQGKPAVESKLLTNPLLRLTVFTLGVLALLSIAAVLMPSANITLKPKIENQELILSVQANPEIASVNYSGYIPTHIITVEVEGRSSIPTSGIIRVPEDYAQGRILFTNLTDRTILIPAGTVVRSLSDPPVRFATLFNVQVPAGVGERASVSVQATEAGITGNLNPETLVAIEGELGTNLKATNPSATHGGSDRILAIATKANQEQLFNKLKSDLEDTALDEMLRQISPGDILFTQTITLSQVVEQIYESPPEIPGDMLTLSLRLEFQAQYVSEAQLKQLATYLLDANAPQSYQAVPDSLVVKRTSIPQIDDDGNILIQILAQRQMQAIIPQSQAVNLTLGQTIDSAVRRLQSNLPLSGSPFIQISPEWWPRMPVLPFRVAITSSS